MGLCLHGSVEVPIDDPMDELLSGSASVHWWFCIII